MAVKEGKRVVSAFWLNDVLLQKKMVPPWQALHLPLSFNTEKPGRNQIIAVTNFDGAERERLKQMISIAGAKYTGYMTVHNSALICKKPGGKKFEKAKEWRIAVVNVAWLSDLVLGRMDALRLPVDVRYLQVGQGKEFHCDLARVAPLMQGWKAPLRLTKDAWKRIQPSVFSQENSIPRGPPPPKRQKVDPSPPPNPTQAVEAGLPPRVLFTLYPKTVTAKLEAIVRSLGGVVVTSPRHCTHLVAPTLGRSIKFFVAISCCRHVLTRHWLDHSQAHGAFLEEANFALKDEQNEATLGFQLAESLKRAQSRPLFKGLSFYISKSVVPPACELSTVIQAAGGTVSATRPSARQMVSPDMFQKSQGVKHVIITCDNDLHLFQDLRQRKIPVYNSEFVLSGVMRQEVDFSQNFTISFQQPTVN